ncbi:MAG: GGDEF domain-containing protein [Chloroherpetonaceae bacterium]|nr:GGDEF domain-containing protein [Chloroherpetonaceae bacterium]
MAMRTLEEKWAAIVFDIVDYAFEPIINVHTGAAFGFEALLRNYQAVGFDTIQEFFDAAYREKVLFKVELFLREKAIQKFIAAGLHEKAKLFFNVDARIINMPDYQQGHTARILARYGLKPHSMTFEITERQRLENTERVLQILRITQAQSYNIAIDDFGVGYSGLQLLYTLEPDFIKIDRFFISNLATDSKKRFFVTSIVNMAHLLGITVIAEGIETEQEYYVCRDLGCDFVQGYLFQAPTTDITQLQLKYEYVERLARLDRRKSVSDQQLIYDKAEYIPQLSIDADMEEVFNYFLENKHISFCPITTPNNEPVGIVRERDIKAFAYSLYGRQLLKNKSAAKSLKDFIVRCPIVDINTRAEQMLEIFSMEDDAEGIIIVEDMQYIGFLSTKSLLRIINEKNVAAARDQNPLTKLPGNTVIHAYVSEGLEQKVDHYALVYYDFNNFKPYNDKYGFRRGDKAILLFADILRRRFTQENCLVGHIGGDDFFLGFKNVPFEDAYRQAKEAIVEFTESVKELYDEKDRLNGYLEAKDREGNLKRFPLLTVSAAMLVIAGEKSSCSMEEVSMILAEMKKMSKSNSEKITAATVYRRLTDPVSNSVVASSESQALKQNHLAVSAAGVIAHSGAAALPEKPNN